MTTGRLHLAQPGDLIFCGKPGFLQGLSESAGDPFRHTGIVVDLDGLRLAEIDDNSIRARTLSEIDKAYSRIAIARPTASLGDAAAEASDWAARQVGDSQLYPWDDCFLVGLLSSVRASSASPSKLRRVVSAAVERAERRPKESGLTCSAFVGCAFEHAGVRLVPSLAFPRFGEGSVASPTAHNGPPPPPVRVAPRQIARMAQDAVALTRALRPRKLDAARWTSHPRLLAPADLWSSPSLAAAPPTDRGTDR